MSYASGISHVEDTHLSTVSSAAEVFCSLAGGQRLRRLSGEA
jgi:hypothetical protein